MSLKLSGAVITFTLMAFPIAALANNGSGADNEINSTASSNKKSQSSFSNQHREERIITNEEEYAAAIQEGNKITSSSGDKANVKRSAGSRSSSALDKSKTIKN